MSAQPYPVGMDYVWLASDQNGHVGAFVTAGVGPVPATVLEMSLPIEDIEALVLTLPRTTTASTFINVPDPDSWIELAERGLFVMDWWDVHRRHSEYQWRYDPVAKPLEPIALSALPILLRHAAEAAFFGEVRFADLNPIDVTAYLRCLP